MAFVLKPFIKEPRFYESAKEIYAVTQKGRPENVVYLAQQAAEKSIKAALNHLRISFPFVHELGTLVALFPDELLPPGSFDLSVLNPYASALRYEEPNAELKKEEINACLEMLAAVLKWSDQVLNKK